MADWMRRLRNRLRFRRFDRDVAEELAFHREMKVREVDARRLGVAAAEAAAGRELGNVTIAREHARAVWIAPWLDGMRQDLRDALRTLVRRPALSATAIAALGLGSSAAITGFSLVDALLLRPLPVGRPHELVWVREPSFSYAIVRELRARSSDAVFAAAFGWGLSTVDVSWAGDAEPSTAMLVTGPYYAATGVSPAAGRLLTDADEASDADHAVAVLSHRAWSRRFAEDPRIVGRTLRVEDVPVTIVGVSAPGFTGVAPGTAPELTMPAVLLSRLRPDEGDISVRPNAWLHLMARVAPGLSIAAANQRFQPVWSQVLAATTSLDETPERRARFLSRRATLESAASGYSAVRNEFRRPVWVLAALVGLVGLVACATAANVFLASALARSREVAMRAALGCGRRRLVRQLVVEGVVVAAVAAAAGFAFSRWSVHAIVSLLATRQYAVVLEVAPDWRLLLFVAACVMTTTLLFALAPAILVSRVDPAQVLQGGARLTVRGRSFVSSALVVSQTAFSVVLLVAAVLFLRSLGHLLSTDPGFDPARLLVFRLDASPLVRGIDRMEDRRARLEPFYAAAIDRLAAVPQVERVGISWFPPLSGDAGMRTRSLAVDGAPVEDTGIRTLFTAASPGYFAAVGTPLLRGRDFSRQDTNTAERVVIVNRTLAAAVFGGENALGRRLSIGLDESRRNLLIVGIVGDAKYQRLHEPRQRIAYLPYQQLAELASGTPMVAAVRVRAPGADVEEALRRTMRELDSRIPIRIERMDDRLLESLVRERLLATLAVWLAAAALALAAGSLLGLMLHLVGRRTQEFGVRLALGARPGTLVAQVLGQTLRLALVGIVLGACVSVAAGRLVAGLLYGVAPADGASLAVVTAIALVASAVAGLVPALRAARVDPLRALRMD